MITLNSRASIKSRVLFRDLDNESVLLELDRGIYYGLNEVGTLIWHCLQKQEPIESICRRLLEEYDVTENWLQETVLEFVDLLAAKGLVEVQDA